MQFTSSLWSAVCNPAGDHPQLHHRLPPAVQRHGGAVPLPPVEGLHARPPLTGWTICPRCSWVSDPPPAKTPSPPPQRLCMALPWCSLTSSCQPRIRPRRSSMMTSVLRCLGSALFQLATTLRLLLSSLTSCSPPCWPAPSCSCARTGTFRRCPLSTRAPNGCWPVLSGLSVSRWASRWIRSRFSTSSPPSTPRLLCLPDMVGPLVRLLPWLWRLLRLGLVVTLIRFLLLPPPSLHLLDVGSCAFASPPTSSPPSQLVRTLGLRPLCWGGGVVLTMTFPPLPDICQLISLYLRVILYVRTCQS